MKPTNVKINLLSVPWGVDKAALTFSFAIDGMEDAVALSAVRFSFARPGEEPFFDTDFFPVDNTCGIEIEGLCEVLSDDALYTCRVQVKDQNGKAGEWSSPLAFSTAPADWDPTGVWCDTDSDFCLLRREFSLEKLPCRALLQVTARSPEKARQYIYQLSCNGEFVGMGPTRLGKEGEREVLYYETMDVTPLLKEGRNCIGAVCYTPEEKIFTARLTVFDQTGEKTVVFDDADGFEALDGTPVFRPDGSIGTNYYPAAAENINGEQYPYGWDECLYSGDFAPAVNKGKICGDGVLLPYPAPMVKRFLSPAFRQETLEDGTLFVDLGKEIIGGIRLQVTAAQPKELTLRYGEELTDEGRVRYKMRTGNVYEEHWRLAAGENILTSTGMKTFRYVEILGLGDEEEALVSGCAYRTDFDETASYFTSSSELLNEIYDLCKYTIKATNQHLWVDSQSRERCAYEGDVLINMLTAAGVEDCNALARWSIDYLTTHRTWPVEYVLYCILMAKADYLYTGDKALIRKVYPLLKEQKLYTDYLDNEVGLVRSVTMAGNVMDAVLVDWPMSERDGYDYKNAAYNTVFNSIHYRAFADLAYLAGELGYEQDKAYYDSLARSLKAAMIGKLYDSQKGCFADGLTEEGERLTHCSQHATAYTLYAGVYDSYDMQQTLAAYLEQQGEIRMSVYGAHFLLEGLYAAGAGKAANALLLNEDNSEGARTWCYMLDKLDATITTEAWNTVNKGNMTWSHPWGSAAGSALVRGLFGIQPLTPGYKDFSVNLQPDGLRYAAIQVPTVKGAITASFDVTREDCDLLLTVKVPANATAHISVPAPAGKTVTSHQKEVSASYENGCYRWQVGSGEYLFQIG